ncbi:SMP-30/gluconolactonase/LRE family protein [Hymenobacter sp. BRD128]|uniref:SMP-30/gluconolactonase/LRE family protein n=1 Tax=Hymenobacter sp. BRD128 TaxID=2675878 RepID=UPI001566C719|nr:SMP-30/gluconolactonase/LRE family protein [Hymenobacter sp. BRD128]QKG55541.1 SMP-30/gluconolactonase/LRE family protein [Hymenobacter sp. BRD128]
MITSRYGWAAAAFSATLLASCGPQQSAEKQAAANATDKAAEAQIKTDSATQGATPRLLATFPDSLNTPDGLALAPDGRVFLSVPNLADNKYPARIVELTASGYKPFINNLPPEPTTKHATPMDLAVGPDGNLYYAENQYENSKDFKSRLMRVLMHGGKPGKIETAVDGFALANGTVWKGNNLYVTDSQWDLPGNDKGSAIMRFTLADLKPGTTIHLKPKTQDPHVLAMFTTTVNETGIDNGADGIDYDSQGRLYTGSYGDGTLYRITLKPDGSFASQEKVPVGGAKIPCIDGLVIDRATDKAYICSSRLNSIDIVNLKDNTHTVLARNGDTNGAGGKLDQPAEVLLKGKQLIISDYDKPDKKFVNTKSDAPHTESVIDLP